MLLHIEPALARVGTTHPAHDPAHLGLATVLDQSLNFVHEDSDLAPLDHICLTFDLLEPVGHVAHRLQVRDVADDDESVHLPKHLIDRRLVALALRVVQGDRELGAVLQLDFVLPYFASW